MFDARKLSVVIAILIACSAAAGETLRDPTRPYSMESAPTERTPGFRVSAIFVSERRRVAVLNGRAVSVGDRVGDATVTAIGERTVSLSYQGRTVKARLKTAKIRQ